MFKKLITGLPVLLLAATVYAAGPPTGPIIKDFGPVFSVPEGSYNLAKDTHYKVSMDVSATGDFPEDLNRNLVSAARFLNMHARNGIEQKNIEFALIVHGPASKDMLGNEGYEKRYQEVNPNTQLLNQLSDAGVKIYLCGQSAKHMKIAAQELNPAVTMALSAMSAHVRLQSEGYTLIPF
ncbi:MAG: DsrE family protein [Proteobacteria bacterium]|nr:DsrE family protein [Pseudomonadota bacterium]